MVTYCNTNRASTSNVIRGSDVNVVEGTVAEGAEDDEFVVKGNTMTGVSNVIEHALQSSLFHFGKWNRTTTFSIPPRRWDRNRVTRRHTSFHDAVRMRMVMARKVRMVVSGMGGGVCGGGGGGDDDKNAVN